MLERSIEETLNDVYMFSVVHNNVFSILNMTEEEIRQSIVEDLLLVTMIEIGENTKLHFGFTKFLRWLPRYLHKKVIKQLRHDEINGLIEIKGREIRIRNNRTILQAAMDYCGHWYEGFDIPNEPGIITVNREKLEEAVEEAGGVDQLAEKLAKKINADMLDQLANVPVPTSIN